MLCHCLYSPFPGSMMLPGNPSLNPTHVLQHYQWGPSVCPAVAPPVLRGPVVTSRVIPNPWETFLCAGPLVIPYTPNPETPSASLTCATAHTRPLGTFTACAPVTPRGHVPLSAQCTVPSLSTPRLQPVTGQDLTVLGLSPCPSHC